MTVSFGMCLIANAPMPPLEDGLTSKYSVVNKDGVREVKVGAVVEEENDEDGVDMDWINDCRGEIDEAGGNEEVKVGGVEENEEEGVEMDCSKDPRGEIGGVGNPELSVLPATPCPFSSS
jgi:hypothetical protein